MRVDLLNKEKSLDDAAQSQEKKAKDVTRKLQESSGDFPLAQADSAMALATGPATAITGSA